MKSKAAEKNEKSTEIQGLPHGENQKQQFVSKDKLR
jgi:hypothetical protein